MSSSFKNLQNKLLKLKKEIAPDEPERRSEAFKYLDELTNLIHASYKKKSTSDYMFIKTLYDSVSETKYFGGFTQVAKERLRIIENEYNYIYEQDGTDIK